MAWRGVSNRPTKGACTHIYIPLAYRDIWLKYHKYTKTAKIPLYIPIMYIIDMMVKNLPNDIFDNDHTDNNTLKATDGFKANQVYARKGKRLNSRPRKHPKNKSNASTLREAPVDRPNINSADIDLITGNNEML